MARSAPNKSKTINNKDKGNSILNNMKFIGVEVEFMIAKTTISNAITKAIINLFMSFIYLMI